MSIIQKLSSSLDRRDQEPNIKLAETIVAKKDKHSVKELIDNLQNKNKNIQGDCIKTLDEISSRNPDLLSGYAGIIISLLDHKNNRMQWGAMCVLDNMTLCEPAVIYKALGKIISAADHGTVITKDHTLSILLKFCSLKKYAAQAFPLLLDQILSAPPNQLPTYAEKALPFVTDQHKKQFLKTLIVRLDDIETDTKRKRLEKVIQKLTK